MLWPPAISWGILPTLHCYLGVNCSALCEWIFGRRLLMTMYVSPPALFTPRIAYWIYWLFFIGWGSTGQILGPVSAPERSAERSNDTEVDIKWDRNHIAEILIIASCFSLRACVVKLSELLSHVSLVFSHATLVCMISNVSKLLVRLPAATVGRYSLCAYNHVSTTDKTSLHVASYC